MIQLIWGVAAAIGILCGAAGAAQADEQMVPLVTSGNWVTMAHSESMTARPDVCMAINAAQMVAFRADQTGTEFRIVNQKWSLPVDVQGNITIDVNHWATTLPISSNTATMVSVIVPSDTLLELFANMDKASAMSVVVGKAKPFTVSLSGSSKATNAFRTCAGIQSNDKKAGENPFQ